MITLNNSQQQVFNDAIKWWNDRKEQTFEISGPPGSGKTFLINAIIDSIGINRNRIAPMAYTGSAAINMRTKGMMNAKTVFSWLYYTIEEPIYGADGKPVIDPMFNKPKMKLSFIPKEYLDNIDLIIVDEAGTIPPDMRAVIDSMNIPVIAAGDLNQLPPIFGEPGYLNDTNKVHILTEIMRQSANNTIITFSQMALRKQTLPEGIHGNVMVIYDDQLTDDMIMNSDIIICGKNSTREKYIDHIRHDILKINSTIPKHGERVVCRKNNWNVEAGGINLTNGLLGNVTDYPDLSRVDMNTKTFKMNFKADLNNKPFNDIIVDYRYLNANQKEKEQLKNSPYSFGNKFEYGYCITTHMAQGSEFTRGIYIEEYLNKDINNRLNYVGLTRFREQCIYVKRRFQTRYW